MDIDFDLYRYEVRISSDPLVRLSAIDVSPASPQRTIVFIHGFGGKAEQWHYQMQKFAMDNRVIALDMRGHGLSDKPSTGYDMPRIQLDLETALTQLKVSPPFVLVGHSFGGAVVTDYALNHPDHIEKLIIIATAGEFKLSPLFRLGLNLPASVLRLVGPLTRRWLHAPPHALREYYHRNMAIWRGWEKFSQLVVPTLVIRGHRDIVFDRPLFEKVAGSIPGAEDIDIGVSGHMVMLERRETVDRAIANFLKGESKKTWRDKAFVIQKTQRDDLKRERTWLNHYEEGVPYTVDVPRIPAHHLLRSAVRRFPDRPAIFFEGSKMTYRALNHEVNRFANALLAQGIGKGARVVLLLPNIPQMVIGFYGTLKAGGAAVLIPPMTEPEELIRQIKEADASVLVTMSTWAGLAKQIQDGAGVPHVVLTDPGQYLSLPKYLISRWRNRGLDFRNALHWNRWLSQQDTKSPGVDVHSDDMAAIIYTGGTTGLSKGVMLSHRNLVANTLQTRHWLPSAHEGKERFLCVVPFFHSYGMTAALNVPVSLGAALILKPQFKTLDVLKSIKKHKPTIFPGSPSMYVAINNFPGVRKYGIRTIKACISGSAPLPVEVQEAFEKLTKGKLVEGYGLTEASPITHANPLGKNRRLGTIGVPLPSTEAVIVDLMTGRKEMEHGQIGELAIRGPQVMLGYWKNDAATKEVITEDGWLLTGDVAQMDEDGFCRIISRKADMWYPEKGGKEPAFPRDVEEVIYEIPQVKEVAVVAVAGSPFAFVIAGREKPSAESVIGYCKRRLPPHLVPRFVIFMDEFPRTFIGKVLRRELAKRYGKQIASE
ncbi:MAG: alpha/beta fold hydrolase [Anaerolineales bacterium]|nr:alpha/beta fold hydrolase [Anaerolineales bacterium]